MNEKKLPANLAAFLNNKPEAAVALFLAFYRYALSIGAEDIETTKTTVAFGKKRYAYIYQFGKNFIGGVLRMNQLHEAPDLFFKTAKVSGNTYVHHFRLYTPEDLTPELKKLLLKALEDKK